jgi:hypothetical protein
MSKSKTRKPDQRYGVIAVKRSKTGAVIQTSQGPVLFNKDLVGVKNEEQMREICEENPFYFKPVFGERPREPGSRPTFMVPDLPWKKINRRSRLDREEEERERAANIAFDQ